MGSIRIQFIILTLGLMLSLNAGQAHAAVPTYVKKCVVCHSFEQGAKHKSGPNLYGIVGRKAGTAAGYRYSPSLRNAGFIWTQGKLRLWLRDSKTTIRKLTGDPKASTKMPLQKISSDNFDKVFSYLSSLSPAKSKKSFKMLSLPTANVVAKNGASHAAPKPTRMSTSVGSENRAPPVMNKSLPVPKAAPPPAPASASSSPTLKANSGLDIASMQRQAEIATEKPKASRSPTSVLPMAVIPKNGGPAGVASELPTTMQHTMDEMEGEATTGKNSSAGSTASISGSAVKSILTASANDHGEAAGARKGLEALFDGEAVGETESSSAAEAPIANTYDQYKVVLRGHSHLKVGTSGALYVWIGDPKYKVDSLEGMNKTEGTMPALGDRAIVKPFSTAGLKIKPTESNCIKIDPTGVEEAFELIPSKAGDYNVRVTVNLYSTEGCTGDPIPKAAVDPFEIEVKVDKEAKRDERIEELSDVLWEKFVNFWGALVALFFATLLFLLRKKLKKWFGFGE